MIVGFSIKAQKMLFETFSNDIGISWIMFNTNFWSPSLVKVRT